MCFPVGTATFGFCWWFLPFWKLNIVQFFCHSKVRNCTLQKDLQSRKWSRLPALNECLPVLWEGFVLQPEIQISRDILCLPVTLLKALLRQTATRRVLSPTVPQSQGFIGNFPVKLSLVLLRFMDSSLVQSVKLWKVDSGFLEVLLLPGWE